MSFPYTYSDKTVFYDNNFEIDDLKNILTEELLKNSRHTLIEKEEPKTFQSNSPFLKIPFVFEFELNTNEIVYKIHLDSLLKIILIVIIFAALFSYTSLSFFFWFASVFTVLFYTLNIMIINGYLHSLLVDILKRNNLSFKEPESLSEEQKTWLNDKNRCPACGFYLSEIDLICPECGLHLKRNRHTIPLDTSKYQNKPIKYHFKKK